MVPYARDKSGILSMEDSSLSSSDQISLNDEDKAIVDSGVVFKEQ